MNLVASSSDIWGDSNFTTGCQFSPDGLCILTATASDNVLRLYNTPPPSPSPGDIEEKKEHVHVHVEDSSLMADNDSDSDNVGDMVHANVNVNVNATYTRRNFNWNTILSFQCGDSIRSYAWYPLMNSYEPASCAFVACARDQPIHLIDAYTSSIRATYSPYNALDEMESPHVLSFTPDGARIVAAGFRTDRMIHTFDTSRPGRDSDVFRLGKTRRSKDGQKGIVSSLAFPDPVAWGGNHIFAVGTYSPGSIYIYDDRQPSGHPAGTVLHGGISVVGHGKSFMRKKRRFVDISVSGTGPESQSESASSAAGNKAQGEKQKQEEEENEESYADIFSAAKVGWYQSRARSGVTQLTWSGGILSGSPEGGTNANPFLLYSASRRSDAVLAWDMRMLSGNEDALHYPIRGIAAYSRDSNTNQRLEFDLDEAGQRLFVASQDRTVKVYDTRTGKLMQCKDGFHDAVNGVSYSNCNERTLLAVATGARRFEDDGNIEKVGNEEEMDETLDTIEQRIRNPPGSLLLYELT